MTQNIWLSWRIQNCTWDAPSGRPFNWRFEKHRGQIYCFVLPLPCVDVCFRASACTPCMKPFLSTCGYAGGLLPYSLGGGGGAAGFAKVLPFTRPNFVTLYQTKNAHLFLISISCERSRKRDPILDQFSMITRPYTRLENGLKTITFPTAHTHITNIWEYPPPPPPGRLCKVFRS